MDRGLLNFLREFSFELPNLPILIEQFFDVSVLFLVNINMPKMSCHVNILEKMPRIFCVTN